MILPKVLNATEARKNFYQLLKQVSSGAEILIENTDTGEKFQLVKAQKVPKKDIEQILQEMGNIGIKTMPIEEMKKILNTSHDITLE